MPPIFERGLRRFITYKQARTTDFSKQLILTELSRRIEELQVNHHVTAKFADAAVITVQTNTPEIPQAQLDLAPLHRGDPVTLVGYGCDDLSAPEKTAVHDPYGVRRFGTSEVIRVDPVNFCSFGSMMRPNAPSLCPGDSGGPVLRNGKVVGVHGTVHGVALHHGANSNMSVNLSNLAPWSALETDSSRTSR